MGTDSTVNQSKLDVRKRVAGTPAQGLGERVSELRLVLV